MNRICFNGKFLSANPTGVHRVAEELISGIDTMLAQDAELAERFEWELLCPKDANREMKLDIIKSRTVGMTGWQVWEQFELPFYTRDALLVNLCNLAPVGQSNAITMIHDAQTFITPDSYSRAFRIWYQFALPMIGKQNKRILTVSNYSKQKLSHYGIAPTGKIDVIHNGVDHVANRKPDFTIITRLGLEERPFAVGLANVQVHKNLKVVIEAFARPALQDYALVLFGSANREKFEAAGVSVPDNVFFAGYVTEGELAALYSAASMMVFPSTTEGFGLPPLEAMQVGTPAICAPCGSLPEVCGDTADYADPDSADAWETAILADFRMDDAARAAKRDECKAQAAKFQWDKASRSLLDIIVSEAN